MSSRLIRLLLVVLALATGAAATYFLKTIDASLSYLHASNDTLRDRADAVHRTLEDLRAAQTAYVAEGQDAAFWMSQVAKLLPALDQQMAGFNAELATPAARDAFNQAAAAAENFHKLDARAQEYVKSTDRLLAADLIFSDGLEAIGTASAQVDAAARNEWQARVEDAAALRQRGLTILGGGAGGVLLILLLLGFTGAQKKEADAVSTLKLNGADQAPDATEPASSPDAASLSPGLQNAAKLCTDLARVQQASQLPGLLERTANVLDASGLIVWIADPEGRELRAAMAFGYADAVVARMGAIPRDASNAAAASYRSAETRIVSGDGVTSGAVVTPLVTPDGCIGVLSAEMKGGTEKDERAQALAAIFAAQLATLVSPPPAIPIKAAAQA